MKNRNGWWLALILALACAGLGWGWRRERLLRLALQLQHETDARALAALRDRGRRAPVAGARPPAAATSAAKPPDSERAGGFESPSLWLRRHPELSPVMVRWTRRNVIFRYGDAIAALHLPHETEEKLKQLLVEEDMSTTDARGAALAAGLKAGTPEYSKALDDAKGPVKDEIAALIGTESSSQLEVAGAVTATKSYLAQNMAPDFTDAGLPLSADQLNGLSLAVSQIYGNAGWEVRGNDPSWQPDPQTNLSPNDVQLLAKAGPLLTPAQLTVLQQNLQQQNQGMSEFRRAQAGPR